MPLGLADDRVVILDPACGTGTFLYEVIRVIHDRITPLGKAAWKECANKLMKRLFGFELLMTPYTICHLKLEQLLEDYNYKLDDNSRLGIFLTNTLEEVITHETKMVLDIYAAIEEERSSADRVKITEPVMIILGNPPYNAKSKNKGKWITKLLKSLYYPNDEIKEDNPKPILNDYVKFIRWAQWRIDVTGKGIIGMVTAHSFLDAPIFRQMRKTLLDTFTSINILNLHGNKNRKEVTPSGNKDDGVFAIKEGVSVNLFVKKGKNEEVLYCDLWGLRNNKFRYLFDNDYSTSEMLSLQPSAPFYLLIPREETYLNEYNEGIKINHIFTIKSVGIVTSRDKLVIALDEVDLTKMIADLKNSDMSNEEIKHKYLSEDDIFDLVKARNIVNNIDCNNYVTPILYKPFDVRVIFYRDEFIERRRYDTMRLMLETSNIALLTSRSNKSQHMDHFFCTSRIIEYKSAESTTNTTLFPLYTFPKTAQKLFGNEIKKQPNINSAFITELETRLGLKFQSDNIEASNDITPESIFNYVYAILYSPAYRTRYMQFMRTDFPRIPFPNNTETFFELVKCGEELKKLHLQVEAQGWLWEDIIITGDDLTVGTVDYNSTTEEIILDSARPHDLQLRIARVPLNIWEFQIGGYQVLKHWLTERVGREISLREFIPIIISLKKTDRIMREEIDPLFNKLLQAK